MLISIKDKLPGAGAEVLCQLKHCHTGNMQEHRLIRVEEDDCSWRTADDRSELSYDWNVVAWYEP